MSGGEIFFIIILVLFIIGEVVWAVKARSNLIQCETSENPACPTFSCGNLSDTSLPACTGPTFPSNLSFPPYRTTDSGAIECQGDLLDTIVLVRR